jgi:hypothetical protein
VILGGLLRGEIRSLNKNSLPIRVFLIGSILLQAIFCGIRWVALLKDPGLNGIDFISFYTAGRIARSGDYAHLYDLQRQNEIQHKLIPADTFAGGVNLSQHPPYLAPLLSIIAGDDYVKAYMIWSAILAGVLVICFLVIGKYLLWEGWDRSSAVLCAANCAFFYPVLLSLLKGQDTAFILIGLLFWMIGIFQRKEMRSGFGLALSTLSPPIAGALSLPLIASRRKAAGWFCLAFSILAVISLALVGLKGARDYLQLLLISSQGQGYALNPSKMFNFLGWMLRSFPTLSLSLVHGLTWSAVIASLIASIWLWWGKRNRIRAEHIGLVVVLATFTSPHLHLHSVSFLLLPLLVVSTNLWKQNSRLGQLTALLLVPFCSLFMEASNLAGEQGLYTLTYLLMAALAGWFIYLMIQYKPEIDSLKGI